LPLDAYVQDNSQNNAIDQATNELIARCMRAKGFTMAQPTAFQQALSQADNAPPGTTEPYGVTSMAQAAQYGYSSPVSAAIQRLKAKYHVGHYGAHAVVGAGSLLFGPKESPAYNVALIGYPSGNPPVGYDTVKGCTGQAYAALDGGPAPVDPHNLVGSLAGTAEQETESNPQVVQAMSGWSACMHRQGYTYQTPMQAAAVSWPASPSPLEISTAKADVACKQRTDLPGIWERVEAGYERSLINQNAAALAQVKQATAAEIRRAESVLSKDQ